MFTIKGLKIDFPPGLQHFITKVNKAELIVAILAV